ncbi:MAG TPA: signal peptidase I [Kofleriaceae bacterium]|nr:signal peptidase I [Kofleriaceae bacterium]
MVIVTLLFPGFGQALVHRRVRAVAWAVAALVGALGILASVWLYPVTLVVHVASAIDAGVVVRRDPRPGGLDRVAGAVVVVFGAIGAGFSQLALQSFRVPSSSMYPTIKIGDHVFVDKLTPLWRPIARGELVVVRYPCDPRVPYVKRVIAIGGDTVEVRCDVVYVNGKAVPHTLVARDWEYEDRDERDGSTIRRKVSRWHEVLDGHAYDVYEGIGRGRAVADGAGPDGAGSDSAGSTAGGEPASSTAGGIGVAGERDFPQLDSPFAPGCANEAMFREPTRSHEVKGELVETNPGSAAVNPGGAALNPGGTAVNPGGAEMNADSSACALRKHYVVPKGALFTMGDNRYNANDSRFFGAVREDDVIGRIIGVWWNAGGVGRIGALH